jgi:hypothetical protein
MIHCRTKGNVSISAQLQTTQFSVSFNNSKPMSSNLGYGLLERIVRRILIVSRRRFINRHLLSYPPTEMCKYIACAPVVDGSGIVWITILRQLLLEEFSQFWQLQKASKCTSGFQRFGSSGLQTEKLEDTGDDPFRFFLWYIIPRLQRVSSLKVESLELLDESVSFQCFTEPVIFRLINLSWPCALMTLITRNLVLL